MALVVLLTLNVPVSRPTPMVIRDHVPPVIPDKTGAIASGNVHDVAGPVIHDSLACGNKHDS